LERLPGVSIIPGTDVSDLTRRFQVWQAMTHLTEIDNPMDSPMLDSVVDALGPMPGMRAIDIPCGRGELLIRLAGRGVEGEGVDISPWVIRDAHERATSRGRRIALHLGDAKAFPRTQEHQLACSLGGSWIWNGTAGTLRALSELVLPGGRVALGDVVLRDGADPAELEGVGAPLTRTHLGTQARAVGLEPIEWFVADTGAWEEYVWGWSDGIDAFTRDPTLRSEYRAFAATGTEELAKARKHFEWVVLVAEARRLPTR
jgi:hypothetical protein